MCCQQKLVEILKQSLKIVKGSRLQVPYCTVKIKELGSFAMKLRFHVILLAVAFAVSAVAVADADAKNPNMGTLKKPKKGEKRCEINGVGQWVCRTKRR